MAVFTDAILGILKSKAVKATTHWKLPLTMTSLDIYLEDMEHGQGMGF